MSIDKIIESREEFIIFKDIQQELSEDKSKSWIIVYSSVTTEDKLFRSDRHIFSALLPNNQDYIKEFLSTFTWGIQIDFFYPTFDDDKEGKIIYKKNKKESSHLPFEPMVLYQSFYDLKDSYFEIIEEFRLYHKLYYDSKEKKFIHINESGEEDIVAVIEKNNIHKEIKIKTRYIKDFLAAKNLVLVRFHDHRRLLSENIKISEENEVNLKSIENSYCYDIFVSSDSKYSFGENWKTFSRLCGKDILFPFSEPLHEDYKYLKDQDERKYADFIIGIDEKGEEIEHTCNPEKLRQNNEGPFFLTPVFFKREVLKKYYDNPAKYEVEDSLISCGNLWCIRYGQNSLRLVHAWLGDLGIELPYNEQLYWKHYNVPPEGGIGRATYERELEGEFADPDEMTHIFKQQFKLFCKYWKAKYNWDLFLPLNSEDEHYYKTLRVPTTEDPIEFEQQITAISKILNESINIDGIKSIINLDEASAKKLLCLGDKDTIGSIKWLKILLISYFNANKSNADKLISSFDTIQLLRSKGVAHKKGNDYKKVIKKLGLDQKSLIEFFEILLNDTIKTFNFLSHSSHYL